MIVCSVRTLLDAIPDASMDGVRYLNLAGEPAEMVFPLVQNMRMKWLVVLVPGLSAIITQAPGSTPLVQVTSGLLRI